MIRSFPRAGLAGAPAMMMRVSTRQKSRSPARALSWRILGSSWQSP